MSTEASVGHIEPRTSEKLKESRWSFANMHGSALAWVILGLSALITIAAWHISNESVEQVSKSRFTFKTQDIRTAIGKRMQEQEAALWGGVGLFNSSENVTREEWAEYAAALQLEKYLPGLQGYGYAESVRPANRDRHVNRIRSEGFPDFDIRPEGKREIYSSIIYLEPFRDRNLRAFGYDMFSEPTRREAMERARDTGEAAVSGMVTLVQETESDIQRGFLMYLPVYKKGLPINTVEERRAALRGFVYSPFRIKDLTRGILGKGDTEIDFRIYDGAIKSPERLMYDSAKADASFIVTDESLFSTTASLRNGGHPWTLEFNTRPGFVSTADKQQPMYIAIGGILIDILLFLTISSLSHQRRRALAIAERMTGELRMAKDTAEEAARNEVILRTSTQEANAKLKVANEGLLKFTSIVAHDLRSPLKRIESFVGILRDDYQSSFDNEGKDILMRIERGSSRMRLMLDSLHNYAKYSDVSIKGKNATVKNIVENAIETLGEEIADARIQIVIDEECKVRGDPILLEHVVQNLIGNSIKFRGKARSEISIATRTMENDMIEMSVSDNGIGIEPKHADKVFGMFSRLHNEDEFEGTGIGLAVCKNIVIDHGGDIWVDTSCTKGTRIVMTLQLATGEVMKKSESLAA